MKSPPGEVTWWQLGSLVCRCLGLASSSPPTITWQKQAVKNRSQAKGKKEHRREWGWQWVTALSDLFMENRVDERKCFEPGCLRGKSTDCPGGTFFSWYPQTFVSLPLTDAVAGHGKKTHKKQKQKHGLCSAKSQCSGGASSTLVRRLFLQIKIRLCDELVFCAALHTPGGKASLARSRRSPSTRSCPFPLQTTNLLARAFCRNGNCFAWQGIILKQNNGSSCEIWQLGLTFGSPSPSPSAYLRKQVVFCTPSGRGVAGKPNLPVDLE